jgi:hypothetical protein
MRVAIALLCMDPGLEAGQFPGNPESLPSPARPRSGAENECQQHAAVCTVRRATAVGNTPWMSCSCTHIAVQICKGMRQMLLLCICSFTGAAGIGLTANAHNCVWHAHTGIRALEMVLCLYTLCGHRVLFRKN